MFGFKSKKSGENFFTKAGFGTPNGKESLDKLIPVAAYEGEFIIFKDGTVSVGFEVENVEMEKWDAGQYENFNRIFQNVLGFLPKNTIVQKLDIYYEDRKATTDQDDSFYEKKYYELYMDRPFYNHKSYLYVTSGIEKIADEADNTLVQYRKIKLEDTLVNISQTKEQFKVIINELEAQLRNVDEIKFVKLNEEENKELYRSMLNMEFRYKNADTYKSISSEGNYLTVGDMKVNFLSMVGQASEIEQTRISSNGVVAPFTYNIGIMHQTPHIVCRAYRILDTEEQIKKLDRLSNINASISGDDGQIKSDQIKQMTDDLRAGQGSLIEFSFSVGVMAKGERRRTDSIIETRGEMLSWEGSEIHLEALSNLTHFFGMLPGNASQLYRYILMPTEIAMCYNDFTTNVMGEADGELVADRFRNVLKFKLYNTGLVNQNFILIGPSGSGKSYTMGHFIYGRYNKGIRQIILDVGGTYKQIFDAVGGKFYEYNPEKPISFNPFLVPFNETTGRYELSPEKANFIKSLFAYLIKGEALTKAENALYDMFTPEYYKYESELKKSGNDDRVMQVPSLANFRNWLQKLYFETKDKEEYLLKWKIFEPEKFVLTLQPYVDGEFKELLNSKDVLDISDYKLVCFDMAKIKDNQELYPLVTMLLTELSFDVIRKFPDEIKVFLMDEAWSMLQDGMGDFVEYMYRTLRKNKGQMGIITQGITEIVNSKVGKALINNSETKIILRHTNLNELDNLQAHLGFTDAEISKVANVKFAKGARQFFVKQGQNSQVYTLETPLEETAVLTSQPDERNHLLRLKDRYLGNVNNAIQQWVEDFKNNTIKRA